MSEYQGWISLLNLPSGLDGPIVFVVAMIFFLLFIFLPFALTLDYIERKMVADLQARVGPNRTPLAGFFQPLSDLMKMFSKTRSSGSSEPIGWALVQSAAIYSTFAILPLGSSFLFLNSELNALIAMVAMSIYFLATVLLGLENRSLESILSSFRSSFHFLAGMLPALLCVLTVGMLSGSLNWIVIGNSQNGGPGSWVIFSNPFGFLSFLVFILAGLLMFQFPPFHLSDEGAAHYWGRRLALFKLNRAFLIFSWTLFAVVLYLGAWDFPMERSDGFLGAFFEISSVLLKTFLMVLLSRVASRAFPQVRMDQMTDFSWKVLTPLSLICFLGAVFWAGGTP